MVTAALVLLLAFKTPTQTSAQQASISGKAQQALQYERQGSYAEAESVWQSITAAAPDNAEAWAHLGLMRALAQKYPEAVIAYRKAIQLGSKLPGLQLDLGLALFKQEKFQEAIAPLKAASVETPNDMKPKLLLGMSYYGAAQYSDAIPYLQSAVTSSPENLQLRTVLAQSCLWASQFNCTLEQYKQILQLNPESAQAYMLAGEASDGLGDTTQAISLFRAAEKASPHEPDVHFGLGYLLWTQHLFDEAESEFKLEVEDNPNHAQALAYLGDIAIKKNDEASALDYLNRSIAQPEAVRLAYFDRGIVNAAHRRDHEAEADFQRAIKMAPDEPDAHWRLGRLYQTMGETEQAKVELAKVNQLHKAKDEGLVQRMSGSPLKEQPQ
jgi:tetratricopeptide (TPR) repeat protein